MVKKKNSGKLRFFYLNMNAPEHMLKETISSYLSQEKINKKEKKMRKFKKLCVENVGTDKRSEAFETVVD